jgi:hypothetical protein
MKPVRQTNQPIKRTETRALRGFHPLISIR